jgi:23S rRNA pseudouridine2605 synthase
MTDRLQKILARAGIGSRRACEEFIAQGRVTVNGKVAALGDKADPERDHITLDGKRLRAAEKLIYVALHKPRNVISAVTSPDPRPTVRELIPLEGRLYPVGRLDIESEGLILLTNDGELANRVTHPRYGCEKEYRALVPRAPDAQQLEIWRNGVVLEDGYKTAPASVRLVSETPRGAWLQIIMKEGRKRQIREIGERIGLPVLRLQRVRIGNVTLGKLKVREWRELSAREVADLKKLAQPAAGKPPASGGRAPRGSAPPAPRRRKT